MPMTKQRKTKQQKTRKQKKQQKTRKQRGGCNCGKVMNGGYGPASYQGIPSQDYYPLNDYKNDPNDPHIMNSERLTVGGGKSKTMKKTKKSIKKTRGGDPLLGNLSSNPIASFGTTSGVNTSYNIMNGISNVNPSDYSQPMVK